MRSFIIRLIFGLAAALPLSTTLYAQTGVSIEITGIEQNLETNVRLYLSLEQQKTSELLTPTLIRRLHQKADKEIAAALQPYGYYRAIVDSSLLRESET